MVSLIDTFTTLLSAENTPADLQVELVRAFGSNALPLAVGIFFYATARDQIKSIEKSTDDLIQANKELTDKQIENANLKMENLFKEYFKKPKY